MVVLVSPARWSTKYSRFVVHVPLEKFTYPPPSFTQSSRSIEVTHRGHVVEQGGHGGPCLARALVDKVLQVVVHVPLPPPLRHLPLGHRQPHALRLVVTLPLHTQGNKRAFESDAFRMNASTRSRLMFQVKVWLPSSA
jgi:hypothetical protein